MKNVKKFISSIMAVVVCVSSLSVTAFAAPQNTEDENHGVYSSEMSFDQEDMDFLEKVVEVGDYFYFRKGVVRISLTKEELLTDYGFSEQQYERLVNEVLLPTKNTISTGKIPKIEGEIADTNAFVSNWTLYITHDDLCVGAFAILGAAAYAGPAAMVAAINALSNMIPAPAGTILGVIITAFSITSITELCGRVIWAISSNQGIYFRLVASYPPIEVGYWR